MAPFYNEKNYDKGGKKMRFGVLLYFFIFLIMISDFTFFALKEQLARPAVQTVTTATLKSFSPH